MEKQKIERVASLKDEVKDFHPVLAALFNKLPSIISVEYRQGPHEMGADFVLTKFDETLTSNDYIGVIVKTGTIKQGHQEIERQIGECELGRKVEGGKKTIILNEIWVVCNEGITANAQDVIHHKYANKNIKFLSGEKISELIDKYFPQFWAQVDVKIGEYLEEVEQKSRGMAFGTGLVATKNVADIGYNFIRVESVGKNFRRQKKKEIKRDLRPLSTAHQFLLIEGMMGMGKSTALGQFARLLASPEVFNTDGLVPILMPMKEAFTEFGADLEKIVSRVRTRLGQCTASTGFVVMLDALDELDLSPEDRLELLIRVQVTAQTQGCRVIVTSRPLMDPLLEREVEKRFDRYEMTQLTIPQVVKLVDLVCQNRSTSEKLRKDLDKSQLFRSLPKTPISAILLAKILDENVQEIPSTMTELYSKYMELVLGRWDMSKSLQSQMEYDVILNVSIQVARMMIDNSLDRIAASEVRSMCENYIKGRNLKVDCNSVSKKMLGKRELYFVSPFDETVTFNHRTFAEYLYALGLERVGKFEIGDKVYDPYWTATYFFVFGLRRDAPELIEELDKVRLPNEIGRLFKINNHAGFLLAAYLTPYAVIQSSLKIAIGQAAALLREAYSNANSPLAEFSEIQLLCIITCTLCNAYGYDYFKPALYEISVDLYSSPDLKDRMLEIFFVNSALAASSDGKAFDTLISSYGPEIPLPLQVGIMAQAEGCVGNSGILDKYIRNFHKKLKGNPGLRLGLTELVETPISKKKAKMVSGAIQA